jgi:hypothetical protein
MYYTFDNFVPEGVFNILKTKLLTKRESDKRIIFSSESANKMWIKIKLMVYNNYIN